MKALGWSLRDIDLTDIESLLPFVFRLSGVDTGPGSSRVYADQCDWL